MVFFGIDKRRNKKGIEKLKDCSDVFQFVYFFVVENKVCKICLIKMDIVSGNWIYID